MPDLGKQGVLQTPLYLQRAEQPSLLAISGLFRPAQPAAPRSRGGPCSISFPADLVLRDAGVPAQFAIDTVGRLRRGTLVAQARSHEVLPGVAAHPDGVRLTV